MEFSTYFMRFWVQKIMENTAKTTGEYRGNTAQGTPSGFARNLLADFLLSCTETPWNTEVFLRRFYTS